MIAFALVSPVKPKGIRGNISKNGAAGCQITNLWYARFWESSDPKRRVNVSLLRLASA